VGGGGGGGQERLNRTLYTLTGVSVLAIPAQLLTGYFGMNFEAMWLLRWEHGHAFFWAAVAASTAGSALWFRRAMRREPPAPHLPPVRSTHARPRRGAGSGGPGDDG
jgi:hypothetical protein